MNEKFGKDDKIDDKRGEDDGEIEFSWGKKKRRGGVNKDSQFYESFRLDGVEYFQYDSVYLYKDGETEPYIGKILKFWENPKKEGKVKVLWFFRPSEIANYLEGVDVLENELFLATGVGTGLFNINPLEAIAGKCNVVCISKDDRNWQPSVEELEMAHYVFYRTFDVQMLTISDKLGEKIAMVDAKFLLNKNGHQVVDLAKVDSAEVAADVAKPLSSPEDKVVSDRVVAPNAVIGSSLVKDNIVTKDLLDLSKCHTPENHDTAVYDNTVSVAAVQKNSTSNTDISKVGLGVNCDTGLGIDGKQSREKDDAGKPGNASVVVPASTNVLESDKKITKKSSDAKQIESNKVGKCAVTTGNGKGILEPLNNASGPSKKLRLDGSARTLVGSGGTGTQKSVSVSPASNKASQPPGTASEINNRGKLPGESAGVNDTEGKQKLNSMAENKSSDRLNNASVKQPKDLQSDVNKAPQSSKVSKPPGSASEINNTGKLSGESPGVNDTKGKHKLNGMADNKSSDRLNKASVNRSKDLQSSGNKALQSNKASQPPGTASEINNRGKLPGESAGVHDTEGKQKLNGMAENKSIGRFNKASVKQSKDLQSSVNKAPQRPGEVGVPNDKRRLSRERDGISEGPSKKRKTGSSVELKPINKKVSKIEEIGGSSGVKEVTQRPPGRSNWFVPGPWEEQMKEAHEQKKLVLFQNLDPTYSQSDIENIIWAGFGESCTAKILPKTAASSPYSGQAFAILKSREVAQKVINKLERDSLLLPNGRPLVGTIVMNLPGKQTQYFGHMVVEKLKQQNQREASKRDAVSTSHSSQPNTLEYEMALEWRLLQDRSDSIWKALYKKQGEEMKKLKASLKSK